MLTPARLASILSAEFFGGELAELRPVQMKAFETGELLFLRGIKDLAEALLDFRAIVSRGSAAIRNWCGSAADKGCCADYDCEGCSFHAMTANTTQYRHWIDRGEQNVYSKGVESFH